MNYVQGMSFTFTRFTKFRVFFYTPNKICFLFSLSKCLQQWKQFFGVLFILTTERRVEENLKLKQSCTKTFCSKNSKIVIVIICWGFQLKEKGCLGNYVKSQIKQIIFSFARCSTTAINSTENPFSLAIERHLF